jgi:hypothetical protein
MNSAPRRVGRPGTRDRKEPRQYVGFQVPADLKNQLEAAAVSNGRSLSAETTARLAYSFALGALTPTVLELTNAYARGATSVVRWLIDQQESDIEKALLWNALVSGLMTWRANNPPIFAVLAQALAEQEAALALATTKPNQRAETQRRPSRSLKR